MGQVKKSWIEAESRGYTLPEPEEKYACANHFDDSYLKQYISDHSISGRCDYCKSRTKVVDLHDFMEYVAEKITEYFSNPGDEGLFLGSSYYDDNDEEIPGFIRVGSFVAPEFAEHFESTSDLLYELDLITDNETLNQDIENCFLNDDWIQRFPYMMTKRQELSFMWELFSNMVKHEQRFTFFKRTEFVGEELSEDNALMDILTELGSIISSHKLCKIIPIGTELYRCRFTNKSAIVRSFEDITSAPDDKAKQSRMSPTGVSMFYSAFDDKTAIMESSPDGTLTEDPYVIGKFKTKKELTVVDLTDIPHPSFWMPSDWEEIGFLYSFNSEITKSIKRDDSIHVHYIPSQVFTEYLRYIYQSTDGQKIDGVIYRSSLKGTTSKNIVLFYNQRRSVEILDLVDLMPSPSA